MSHHSTRAVPIYLAWQHDDGGLQLRVGDRREPVPARLAELLLGDGGHGLTDDPAVDLLRLEQDLRRYSRHLANQVQHAAEEVAFARDEAALAETRLGAVGRRHQRVAKRYLTAAAAAHTSWVDHRAAAQSWIGALRSFVIDVAVPDGLLGEAARGWQRSPDVPAFVTVFDTERAFLDADPRRGEPARWGSDTVLAGTDFGDLWRRDGDDDDPESAPLPRSGPWRLSYLHRAGEVYASRRRGHLPEQVWLLGTHLHDRESTVALLIDLENHMREPNSMILAAHTVHTEQRRLMSTGGQGVLT